MKAILFIFIFLMLVGSASAATVELSISGIEPDGTGAMVVAYVGAVNSIVYVNATGFSMQTDPLTGAGYVAEPMYIACNRVYTAEMYTSGVLVDTDSIQRTDAGCNQPQVSFSQAVYACDSTVQLNYQYMQNTTVRIHRLDDFATVLWSTNNVNGSGALYPDYNFTPGFSYLVDMLDSDGASVGYFATTSIQLCGTGTDPDDPDGGDGTGDGGSGSGGGTGDGGSGSDGGTDPFTPPNSYDPTKPGDEWKTWIDLNGDRVTSYAETMAAFRYWGFVSLVGSYFLAFLKFGLGFRL